MLTCNPLVFISNMCFLMNQTEKGKVYIAKKGKLCIVETKDNNYKLILSKTLNNLKGKTGTDYQDIILQSLREGVKKTH